MAFIIVEKGESKDLGTRFPITEKAAVIGREAPQNTPDIVLNYSYISRRHAEIRLDHGQFVVCDLGSTNGTTLDEVRMEPGKSYTLRHDSVIGLCPDSGIPRVLLRFKESPTVSTSRIDPLTAANLRATSWLKLDQDKGAAWVDGRQLELSRKEYDLLVYLHARSGKICQRDELISAVWPEVLDASGVTNAAIDQLVHRLRLKVEPDPSQPTRIVSRKGFGYMLV